MIVGRESPARKVFNVANVLLFILIDVMCLYPLWYILIQSFSDGARAAHALILPIDFTLENYRVILERKDIGHALFISVARTVSGTSLTVLGCMMLGYLFTKQNMPFRKFMYRMLTITMYVGGGLIPTYLVYKSYGINNTFWVYILPGIVDAYYVILIKTYVESLPASVEESAMLDGAGVFTIFTRIILPMSLPIIATIAIYASVGQWNAWFDNHIYNINTKDLETLQYLLYKYMNEAQSITQEIKEKNPGMRIKVTPRGVRMTITMITTIPVLCIYPFLQRYLIKGLLIGAVKG